MNKDLEIFARKVATFPKQRRNAIVHTLNSILETSVGMKKFLPTTFGEKFRWCQFNLYKMYFKEDSFKEERGDFLGRVVCAYINDKRERIGFKQILDPTSNPIYQLGHSRGSIPSSLVEVQIDPTEWIIEGWRRPDWDRGYSI